MNLELRKVELLFPQKDAEKVQAKFHRWIEETEYEPNGVNTGYRPEVKTKALVELNCGQMISIHYSKVKFIN